MKGLTLDSRAEEFFETLDKWRSFLAKGKVKFISLIIGIVSGLASAFCLFILFPSTAKTPEGSPYGWVGLILAIVAIVGTTIAQDE